MSNTIYTKDVDSHIYRCTKTVKGRVYVGESKCCDEDLVVESEKVGFTIAALRAFIKEKKDNKRTLDAQISILKSVLNVKIIDRRQIVAILKQLEGCRRKEFEDLVRAKKDLATYIDDKEKFKNRLIKMREKLQDA